MGEAIGEFLKYKAIFKLGEAFRPGPPNNLFGAAAGAIGQTPLTVTPAASRAAAETVRNTYATANPTWLASYDGNTAVGILLFFTSAGNSFTIAQTRVGGQWVDSASTVGVQGMPGSGTDFSNIAAGHVPAIGPGPNHIPFDSGMQITGDGQLLAPKTFGVESGSVDFGDLLTLSESTGFLGILNNATNSRYRIVDFAIPTNAPSSDPRIFALTEAENQFIAQPDFSTTITNDALTFNYTVALTAQSNSLQFKMAAAVTNFRVRIVDQASGVAIKYYPDKASWLNNTGTALAAGDQSVSFGDSPLVLDTGRVLTVDIAGTGLSMLGSPASIPYFAAMVQRGTFQSLAMFAKTVAGLTAGTGNVSVALDNGQYFEVWCYQSSGASLNIGVTAGVTAGGIDAGYANRIQIARLNP